jgi:hypothetical protein
MADETLVLLDDTLTGKEFLEKAGDANYIVVRLSEGRYALAKKGDPSRNLKFKIDQWKVMDKPLSSMPAAAWGPLLVDTIQQNSPDYAARLEGLRPNQYLLVLDGENFVSLRFGAKVVRSLGQAQGPGTLTASGAQPPADAPAKPQERFINVEVRDRTGQPFPAQKQPLQKDQSYKLLFDIDIERRVGSLVAETFAGEKAFAEGEDEIELTVKLTSEDFKIRPEQQVLYVPRQGKSINAADFSIQPLRDGPGVINAIFLKNNNFIQLMTLRFHIGELFTYEKQGRGVDAAFAVQPRDVSLTILNRGNGFDLILISPGTAATATIPLKLEALHDLASQARERLMELIKPKDVDKRFFLQSVQVSEAVKRFALQAMAETGWLLFRDIFFGSACDEQCKNMGRKLRELAQKEKLKIQIFSQEFVLPWGMLYMADRYDPNNINSDLFLGFKHIIEHIPLQQNLRVTSNRVDASNPLQVSLNVNMDIDKAMGVPLIGNQLKYWGDLQGGGARLVVSTRKTRDEVTAALSDPSTPDQVVYFYCHAASRDVGEQGGVNESALVLSGEGRLTLKELKLSAPTDDALPNAPLVFINACESAQLSPLVYDGFVTYFMDKGARGVIGTEVETPALFAVEWARLFFDKFLKGEPLGQITLDLSQQFLKKYNNPMGLLYSLYVDGDTRIEPAVA